MWRNHRSDSQLTPLARLVLLAFTALTSYPAHREEIIDYSAAYYQYATTSIKSTNLVGITKIS